MLALVLLLPLCSSHLLMHGGKIVTLFFDSDYLCGLALSLTLIIFVGLNRTFHSFQMFNNPQSFPGLYPSWYYSCFFGFLGGVNSDLINGRFKYKVESFETFNIWRNLLQASPYDGVATGMTAYFGKIGFTAFSFILYITARWRKDKSKFSISSPLQYKQLYP